VKDGARGIRGEEACALRNSVETGKGRDEWGVDTTGSKHKTRLRARDWLGGHAPAAERGNRRFAELLCKNGGTGKK